MGVRDSIEPAYVIWVLTPLETCQGTDGTAHQYSLTPAFTPLLCHTQSTEVDDRVRLKFRYLAPTNTLV